MGLGPDPIAAHFEALSIARDAKRFSLDFEQAERLTQAFETNIEKELEELFAARPSFFAVHDYAWCKRRSNYRHPIEMLLQLRMLRAISDVSPDHPNYSKLGNICVRLWASGEVNCEAFESAGFKYACLSTAFLKYLNEFVHASFEFRPRLEPTILAMRNIKKLKDWREKDLIRTVKYKTDKIEFLVSLAAHYQHYEVPEFLERRYERFEEPSGALPRPMASLGALLAGVETFALLHEVAHLLEHGRLAVDRALGQETEADAVALSLSIIVGASDPLMTAVLMSSPACMFGMLRHFYFVQRLLGLLAKPTPLDSSDYDRLIAPEVELTARELHFLELVPRYLPGFFASQFKVYLRNFYFLSEVTKKYALLQIMEKK